MSGVGRWRVALSTGTFPSAPPRTVRTRLRVHGSPVPAPLRVARSALWGVCILQPSRSACPRHLPPFALLAAFPRSLAGRHPGDYYGGSVALALAGGRRSRGTSSSHVRDRDRCPTHPLASPHWRLSFPRRCDSLRFMPSHGLAAVVRRSFRRARTFTTGDWDSSSLAFTLSVGSNATSRTASSDRRAFSQHATVLLVFRPRVSW